MRKWIKPTLLSAGIAIAAMQVVRPAHSNPSEEPQRSIHAANVSDPAIRQILRRSCNDCHSNTTEWPWYSHVAPVSWLVVSDVSRGRRAMNMSDWASYTAKQQQEMLQDVCEEISQGEMPQIAYTLMHPSARLTAADREMLCAWTRAGRGSSSQQAKD